MASSPRRAVLTRTDDGWRLRLAGGWRLTDLAAVEHALDAARPDDEGVLYVDGAELEDLDTSGAMLLCQHLDTWHRSSESVIWTGFSERQRALIELVRARMRVEPAAIMSAPGWLHRLGARAHALLAYVIDILAFIGELGIALLDWLRHPSRFRAREFVVQIEAVGIAGLPIVALLTFLIGVVFTYLLGVQVEKFGANIFIVDGVSLAVTRELAPLLTALLIAGRSGAAFTAQIGAMKVTEEIDAIRTLGLSPMQVLVLPRLLAIVLTLPLLAFFADIMGILGAAVVAARQLDITPYTFFSRLQDVLPLYTVGMGLAKTPIFALAIAVLACHNGFAVARDARSVGERTTSTVVRCLVAVILIDALFSIAFPKIKP
jgi:phospholipid/cholesterol/gamma-HCH transport system permease protein